MNTATLTLTAEEIEAQIDSLVTKRGLLISEIKRSPDSRSRTDRLTQVNLMGKQLDRLDHMLETM